MKSIYHITVIMCVCTTNLFAQQQEDELLAILKSELQRQYEVYSNKEDPAYYMAFNVSDNFRISITSNFGSLEGSEKSRVRALNASVRVGDYYFDNTHSEEGDDYNSYNGGYNQLLPTDNVPLAIRQQIWLVTDNAYKDASTDFALKSNSNKKPLKGLPDFTKEEPGHYYAPPQLEQANTIDIQYWEGLLKSLSEKFGGYDPFILGGVNFSFDLNRKYFVSSEGTEIVQNQVHTQLHILGTVKTKDGYNQPYYKSFFSEWPSGLPAEEVLESAVCEVVNSMKLLANAPSANPYSGPAIFSANAAGVFFHEIFGHRIEGHRLAQHSDAQTFMSKMESPILPDYFTIVSDPLKEEFAGKRLSGYFKFDDEGVRASTVKIVENGILKNFLMSRKPIDGFLQSNGHGRAQTGMVPVSRQSNLLVSTEKPMEMAKLRKKLISLCKKQEKDYGFLISKVVGGYTLTNRYQPNVFNVIPFEVFKVFTDGRPDELVTGVTFIGTPLTVFSEIVGASDDYEVFNGICGAESGGVYVSAVAPSLLVNKIETQLTPSNELTFPILKDPVHLPLKNPCNP
ncbi:MAG: TldD/PmbA family protein [Cyclobacteriaceae bacterium]|nr:TldD/PmbA family protein [Cyclobacteriaceae bacterium]